MKPWTYQGQEFNPSYEQVLLNRWYGFVYFITNTKTDRAYIGKKKFSASVTRERRKVVKESDWRRYWGSCEALTADLITQGEEHYSREILSLHPTSQLLSYNEVRQLFLHDVLFAKNKFRAPKYYNAAIVAGRWHLSSFGPLNEDMSMHRPRRSVPSAGSESRAG